MWIMILNEIFHGFKRIWKLYFVNVVSLVIIIMLLAYRDGSIRQMILQNNLFSGELNFRVDKNANFNQSEVLEKISKLPFVLYVAPRIKTYGEYITTGMETSGGWAELIGVNWKADKYLKKFINLKEGRLPEKSREVIIPSSLLQRSEIKVGDVIRISGKTSDKLYNVITCKVVGIYNSTKLTFFQQPRLLFTYEEMEKFFFPKPEEIEYAIFLKENPYKDIDELWNYILPFMKKEFGDGMFTINITSLSTLNPLNVSTQFNFFLIILISLIIIVVLSIVVVVNFNVYVMIYRQKQPYIGALMAMGIPKGRINLLLYLESFVQLLCSLFIATLISIFFASLLSSRNVKGVFEVITVLMAGTNQLDFYIKPYQIALALLLNTIAITFAQLPIFVKLGFSSVCELLRRT
ncbi:MAG: ABC transporter permease [Brevinematia bacterium]